MDSKKKDIIFIWGLASIAVLACYLRIANFGLSPLCDDEAFTVYWASRPLWPFKQFLWGCVNRNWYPPLDFLWHHLIYCLFGITQFTTRIVPCFFDVLTIPVLAYAGYRLAGRKCGLFLALMWCFSPICIYYAKEARVYAQLSFAVSLYILSLSFAIEKCNLKRLLFVALSLVYGFNVSFLFIFALPACCLALLIYFLAQTPLRGFKQSGRDLFLVMAAHALAALAVFVIYWLYGFFKIAKTNVPGSMHSHRRLIATYSWKSLQFRIIYRLKDAIYAPYVSEWLHLKREGFKLFFVFPLAYVLALPLRFGRNLFIKLLLPLAVLSIPLYDTIVLNWGGMFTGDMDIRHVYWFIPFFFLGLGYCASSAAELLALPVRGLAAVAGNFAKKSGHALALAARPLGILAVLVLLFLLDLKSTASLRKGISTLKKSAFNLVQDYIERESASRKVYLIDSVNDNTECRDMAYLAAMDKSHPDRLHFTLPKKGGPRSEPFIEHKISDEMLRELVSQEASLSFMASQWTPFPYPKELFRLMKPAGTIDFLAFNPIPQKMGAESLKKYLAMFGPRFTNCWKGLVVEQKVEATLLSRNPDFASPLKPWSPWRIPQEEKLETLVSRVNDLPPQNLSHYQRKNLAFNCNSNDMVLAVTNPGDRLLGLIQSVNVASGQIVRLSAKVRSREFGRGKYLGARVFFLAPDKKEHNLIWLNNEANWTEKQTVFTNQVSGLGSFVVHMGYTKEAATGLFKDVKMESLTFEDLPAGGE